MRSMQIKEDRFLIQNDSKYYIVNGFTKLLFNALPYSNDLKDLSEMLDISKQQLKKDYKILNKLIKSVPYYDDNITLTTPIKLQWKITPECNLKCVHCYVGDISFKQMPDKNLLKIANKIICSNIMEVTITGGEALTVKILPQILKKLISNGIKVNIFTNAVLLPDLLEKLDNTLLNKNLFFEVSVDGTQDDHDRIRGKGTFEKTIKGIKEAINLGYQITTNTVLSKLNYKSIPALFVFLKKINVQKIQISNIIDSGRASKDMKLSSEEHEWFLKELKTVVKTAQDKTKLLYATMAPSGIRILISDGEKEKDLGTEHWKCGAGIGRATIDFKGNIYCCPFWNKSYLGNILRHDLEDIWQNRNRLYFLKELAKINTTNRVCIVAKEGIPCD